MAAISAGFVPLPVSGEFMGVNVGHVASRGSDRPAASRRRTGSSSISSPRMAGSPRTSPHACATWRASATCSCTAYAEVDPAIVRDVVEHHLGDLEAFVSTVRAHP